MTKDIEGGLVGGALVDGSAPDDAGRRPDHEDGVEIVPEREITWLRARVNQEAAALRKLGAGAKRMGRVFLIAAIGWHAGLGVAAVGAVGAGKEIYKGWYDDELSSGPMADRIKRGEITREQAIRELGERFSHGIFEQSAESSEHGDAGGAAKAIAANAGEMSAFLSMMLAQRELLEADEFGVDRASADLTAAVDSSLSE